MCPAQPGIRHVVKELRNDIFMVDRVSMGHFESVVKKNFFWLFGVIRGHFQKVVFFIFSDFLTQNPLFRSHVTSYDSNNCDRNCLMTMRIWNGAIWYASCTIWKQKIRCHQFSNEASPINGSDRLGVTHIKWNLKSRKSRPYRSRECYQLLPVRFRQFFDFLPIFGHKIPIISITWHVSTVIF